MAMEIPIVDFEKCGLDVERPMVQHLSSVGREMVKAFTTVGFGYLKNVGIPWQKIDEINRCMKRFCDLDPELKAKFKVNENYYGYIGLGKQRANMDRPADLKEAFHMSGTSLCLPEFDLPNEYVPGFSNIYKDLANLCRALSVRIIEALELGLDIKDKNYLKRSHSRMNDLDNRTTLTANYYPPISEDMDLKSDQARLGEHTDFGSFTLLFQDSIGGLQVESVRGNFVEAKPIPGTVMVNIGDALQFWTRGKLKSTRHRVIVPNDDRQRKPRQSVAYFVVANDDVELAEIACGSDLVNVCLPHGDMSGGKVYTAKEYLDMKLKQLLY